MTQFWYSFFNNFSGQVAYESWTLSLYNVLFTVLPPLVIGVFDQFVSARILDRYPQLYTLGQKNEFFTKTSFWLWVANAFYHSLVSSHFFSLSMSYSDVCLGPLWVLGGAVLGRSQAGRWSRQRTLVLGNNLVLGCPSNSSWQGSSHLRVRSLTTQIDFSD